MVAHKESYLGRLYRVAYEFVCGRHPNLRLIHFQWLSSYLLNKSMRKLAPQIAGDVLDVGCGGKPYLRLFNRATSYVGLDIYPGRHVDIVVQPNGRWPLENESFDVVLSTQVIEHVNDLQHMLSEMIRVVKSGGKIVLALPFMYPEHGLPHDYRRFSAYGAKMLFPLPVEYVEKQGGFGSTIVILVLNWIECMLNTNKLGRYIKIILQPILLPLNGMLNLLALLVDWFDVTGNFYSNVIVVFRKS